MLDTFASRMESVCRLVGDGWLNGTVKVNQVYAHYQDSGVGPPQRPHIPASAFRHPRGGEAGYLSLTLRAKADWYLESIGRSIEERTPMAGKMVLAMEDLAREVHARAPREYWILRNSASAEVTSDGLRYFYHPAMIGRLSQAELNAIRRLAGGNLVHGGEVQHVSSYKGGQLSHALRWKKWRALS